MKKFLSMKYLTSVCFLALLCFMLGSSMRPLYYIAYQQLQNLRSGNGLSISEIEEGYNDALPGKQIYITLNGGFQRLLGQRYVNSRYRLDNGHLTYVVPEMDVTLPVENTAAFRDALAEMDIPFAYVNTLFKIDPLDKQLPAGVEDYSDKNVDNFLAMLEEKGVTALDLRHRPGSSSAGAGAGTGPLQSVLCHRPPLDRRNRLLGLYPGSGLAGNPGQQFCRRSRLHPGNQLHPYGL